MTDEITAFIERSAELHSAVEEILTRTEPDTVREQEDIRRDFKLDLKKVYNEVKNRMMELEKINRKIAEEMAQQNLDANKLYSHKITIYSNRKLQNL